MQADATARLQMILAELRRILDIVGTTIARREGILIVHALPKTTDPKKIAAMSTAIVGTSEMAAAEMGLGGFNHSIVDTRIGKMMATGAGDGILTLRLARQGEFGMQRQLRVVKMRGTRRETGYHALVFDNGLKVTRILA